MQVREMSRLIQRAANRWGRWIAAYGRYVASTAKIQWHGRENIPAEPSIWFGWHGSNLIGIALHQSFLPRPAQAFIPPGLVGTTVAGWLEGAQIEPVLLPQDGRGNASAALKAMVRGLSKDGDVMVAVDGPHGPSGWVRPGTFWLGRMTGRPLVPMGIAARPAIRYPRWDRQLIPFPRSRLAVVIGKPFRVAREQEIDQPFLDSMGELIHSVSRLAWEMV